MEFVPLGRLPFQRPLLKARHRRAFGVLGGMDLNLNDLGYIIEGVLERDPMTDRIQVFTVDHQGDPKTIDVLDAFEKYEGQEIKFTLASMENIRKVAEALEGGDEVLALMPEDIPGTTVSRGTLGEEKPSDG